MFHSTADGACPARRRSPAFVGLECFCSIFSILLSGAFLHDSNVTSMLRTLSCFHIFAASFPRMEPVFPHRSSLWKINYAAAFPPEVFHKNAFFDAESSSFLWETLWKLWEKSARTDACLHKPILYPIVENPPAVEKHPNGEKAVNTALPHLYGEVLPKSQMSYLVHFS